MRTFIIITSIVASIAILSMNLDVKADSSAQRTADELARRFGLPMGGSVHQGFVRACEEGRARGEAIAAFNMQMQQQQQIIAEQQYQQFLHDLHNVIKSANTK